MLRVIANPKNRLCEDQWGKRLNNAKLTSI
jgi:hypothetical protein